MEQRSTFAKKFSQNGFSFVEVLVTAALVALIFGGLFAAVQAMINLIGDSKAKAGAVALATERMEYIRSLAYDDVGTDGGVPSGSIPQTSSTTLNGIEYDERVLIEYVDDDADGFGGADTNGILADYKRVKVEYSWERKGSVRNVSLVSNVPPVGIESIAGGGTIRVNVFDATVQPVSGAAVRFVNNSTVPTIDTIRYTDANGIAYLSGAPESAGYEIEVTRSGYSTDGAIAPTASIPNPTTPPVAVVASAISTMNFQIDRVSDVTLTTTGIPTTDIFTDTFSSSASVASTSSTTLSGGSYELDVISGDYYSLGTLRSIGIAPSPLYQWYAVSVDTSVNASTSVAVSVVYFDGSDYVLIPDSDLPGNSSGFTSSLIDLQDVDAGVYDDIALFATLTTIDDAYTPELNEWTLEYIETSPVLGNVSFTLASQKLVGTDGVGGPIPKLSISDTTDGAGDFAQGDVEWGAYDLDIISGYNIVEQCPPNPVVIEPNVDLDITVSLETTSNDYVHVTVTDAGGAVIPSATVRLEKSSVPYDRTQTTSLCGQTTFTGGGLVPSGGYQLTVSASGYTTEVINGVHVSSTSTVPVVLN